MRSREADPEEVLVNLGFGGSETLAKIPARFLKYKSKVKVNNNSSLHSLADGPRGSDYDQTLAVIDLWP